MSWQHDLDNELFNPPDKCDDCCGDCLQWVAYPHSVMRTASKLDGTLVRHARHYNGLCLLDPQQPEPRNADNDACAVGEPRWK